MHIAIDIGGTNLRVAAFENDHLMTSINHTINSSFREGFLQLTSSIKKVADGKKIDGIGISFSGIIDAKNGIVLDFYHLKDWENKPFCTELQKLFNTRVEIENDANAAALGEAKFGAGKTLEKFIYLTWGSGLGGCLVKKNLNTNKIDCQNIEAGHQIVVWNGRECACGQLGCLEAYVGGKQIEKHLGQNPADITDEKIWQDVSEKMAQAIVTMRVLFKTEHFVIGGGLIAKQPQLIKKIQELTNLNRSDFSFPQIELATLGDQSNLYGAYALLQEAA